MPGHFVEVLSIYAGALLVVQIEGHIYHKTE